MADTRNQTPAQDFTAAGGQGGGPAGGTGRVTHAVPAGPPESVAQIAERLFPAYTIDGGRVRLAGCRLEDRLFVHLRYGLNGQAIDRYVDAQGREVEADLVQSLGLSQSAALERVQPSAAAAIARFVTEVFPGIEPSSSSGGAAALLSITAIWSKFAEGKVRFTVGESAVDLPFAGWARTLQPPPFTCPHSGVQTYHLAMIDDGRIVPHDLIGCCEQSGRRTLASELVTCAVSGKRVLATLTSVCPVGGQRLLTSRLAVCRMCGQQVSPAAIKGHRCAACRGLRPASKAGPPLAQIIEEHPALDRWRNWRIAETAGVYILVAAGWMKRLLLVVDKQSLELKRVATGNRFVSHWEQIAPEQYAGGRGEGVRGKG